MFNKSAHKVVFSLVAGLHNYIYALDKVKNRLFKAVFL